MKVKVRVREKEGMGEHVMNGGARGKRGHVKYGR